MSPTPQKTYDKKSQNRSKKTGDKQMSTITNIWQINTVQSVQSAVSKVKIKDLIYSGLTYHWDANHINWLHNKVSECVGFNVPLIGHFRDDFYRPDQQTNSVKALKETSWSSKIRLESHQNHSTMLQ